MLYTENFGLQEYFRFLQIQSHMQITEIYVLGGQHWTMDAMSTYILKFILYELL